MHPRRVLASRLRIFRLGGERLGACAWRSPANRHGVGGRSRDSPAICSRRGDAWGLPHNVCMQRYLCHLMCSLSAHRGRFAIVPLRGETGQSRYCVCERVAFRQHAASRSAIRVRDGVAQGRRVWNSDLSISSIIDITRSTFPDGGEENARGCGGRGRNSRSRHTICWCRSGERACTSGELRRRCRAMGIGT